MRSKEPRLQPEFKEVLHPDFIIEFENTTKFPKHYHKVEQGWEILPEDQFNKEYFKNNAIQKAFLADRKKQVEAEKAEIAKLSLKQRVLQQADQREYEQFLKWKANKQRSK